MIVNVTTIARNVSDDLTYYYVVTGGKIIGSGANVKWDLRDTAPGEYTITVGIGENNVLLSETATATLREKICGTCHVPCDCATFDLVGPEGPAAPGDLIVLDAKASFGELKAAFKYNWTVSAGSIVSDPHASVILVKVPPDMKKGVINASVTLEGTDRTCNCPFYKEITIPVTKTGAKGRLKTGPVIRNVSFDRGNFYTWCPAETMGRSVGSYCPLSEMNTGLKTVVDNPKDGLTYYYLVTGGEIIGDGPNVKWEFGKAPPGNYSVTVGIGRDYIILGNTLTRTVRRQVCPVCDLPCDCPAFSAGGQVGPAKAGDTIVLEASIAGAREGYIFKWSVSAGTILGDPTSPSILVKIPDDFKEGNIHATFSVNADPSCSCPTQASVDIGVYK